MRLLPLDERYAKKGANELPDAIMMALHTASLLSSAATVAAALMAKGLKHINERILGKQPPRKSIQLILRAEIEETIEDYHLCGNGFERAMRWKSR
ncbi:hypothetical protein J5N97_010148 [Dioscorea zingiberensis]|uniref:Uncharacterized protein n=1 Tax=Dioscorea zingiberensis TaxID=325984 RepID=A0A9D5D0Q8_9LILI|nr:hypothetical protein J5N97_010148 [Dioscorea zingiberensis]